FPAIGGGLLFPSRALRTSVVLVGVLGTLGSTVHWTAPGGCPVGHRTSCVALSVGIGLLLPAVGVACGALVARARHAAVLWVAAGLALAALNVVTWHCPRSELLHVASAHLAAAAGLIVAATIAGLWVRGREP